MSPFDITRTELVWPGKPRCRATHGHQYSQAGRPGQIGHSRPAPPRRPQYQLS